MGVWQAVYTAGKYLPTPFTEWLYFHRNINNKKLIEINFAFIPPKSNLKRMDKINKVPETPWVKGFRPLVKKDRKIAYELLNNYMKKFKVWMHFDMIEFKHFVKTTPNVIYPYVVQQ